MEEAPKKRRWSKFQNSTGTSFPVTLMIFQKYVKQKRIDGVLISTSVVADMMTDGRQLSNVTQYEFWTLSGGKGSHTRLKAFVDRLKQNAS
ncbi:hypothetical protein V2K00_19130 [Pseudomonas alliivorans]|nr:hypothetical protein [Pseudomonas alliivorans]